ncbi:MAG: discoidin domain-containing protein [Verrucomicrobia bacterium]|nr:discoidin domain-containing protein [Verrucomicrobiota bacterium]
MSMMVNPFMFGAAPLSFPINLTVNNAGAEAGDASGWTAASGGVLWTSINTTSVGYPPSIYEGSRYFSAGNNANARMYQDIDVSAYASTIDAGGAVAELSARFSTNDSLYDYFSVFLRALDASSSVISSVAQEDLFVQELSLGWYLQDLNMLLPSGTRKVRIEIHATRASGTYNDVFFDDIKLSLQDSSRRITPTYGASVSRGSRTGLITLSTTNLVGFGTLSSMVDGSNSNSWYFNGATNDGTNWITFDFGSGAALVIDEFVWKQQNTVTHGVWRLEGSNDNSSWTQIGSDFTLRNGVNRPGGTSNTGYRYYRLRAMSGSRSASPYLYEIQFRAK